ncbi:hypothetical protein Q1695_016059 [Nippostrongylus brasiliensis]|nr:hypothetical protein Q1695_016059 [Nippostrongylus brasiliensis]
MFRAHSAAAASGIHSWLDGEILQSSGADEQRNDTTNTRTSANQVHRPSFRESFGSDESDDDEKRRTTFAKHFQEGDYIRDSETQKWTKSRARRSCINRDRHKCGNDDDETMTVN